MDSRQDRIFTFEELSWIYSNIIEVDGNLFFNENPIQTFLNKAGILKIYLPRHPKDSPFKSINQIKAKVHRIVWIIHNKINPEIVEHISSDFRNNNILNLNHISFKEMENRSKKEKLEYNRIHSNIKNKTSRGRYEHAQKRAKNFLGEFTLSFEKYEALLTKPCHYCSDYFKGTENTGSGLDRINNDLGYQSNNIVRCCAFCNYLKGDNLSYDIFKAALKSLIFYNKKEFEKLKDINNYYDLNKHLYKIDRSEEMNVALPKRIAKDNNIEYARAFSQKLSSRYSQSVCLSKRKDRDFSLTFEEFKKEILKPCYYCNDYFRLSGAKTGVGLDRKNNALGYTVENSVSCCPHCNYLKRDSLSPEQASIFIRSVIFNKVKLIL